jgi:hypothetical protein
MSEQAVLMKGDADYQAKDDTVFEQFAEYFLAKPNNLSKSYVK